MIEPVVITELPNGQRKVAIKFEENVQEVRRKEVNGETVEYEYFPSRSRTKPEFAKQVDIQRIMKKFQATGVIEPLIFRNMNYGDFSNGADFLEASIKVADAKQQFGALPHEVRNRFANDPAAFLTFLASGVQADVFESIDLGLRNEVLTTEIVDGFVITKRNGFEISRKPVEAPPAP